MRGADVEHHRIGFVGRRLEGLWRKRPCAALHDVVDAVVALLVHGDVHGEVAWRGQQAVGYLGNELLACHVCAQGVVGRFLVSEGAYGLLAHVFAARRSRTVPRVDNGVVGQGHDLVAQAVKQVSCEVLDGELAFLGQVGSPHIAQEQGVA